MSERTHLTRTQARDSALRVMADASQARAEEIAAERNPLVDFIEEQRADREAFKAEVRRKLRRLDRNNGILWIYGGIGWIVAGLLLIFLGAKP